MEIIVTPKITKDAQTPFGQSLVLKDGDRVLGQARWIGCLDPVDGVAQVVELTVAPSLQRRGHGRQLMEALTEQAQAYFKAQGATLRRLWTAIEQVNQIKARAFLMKFTFHHVGTVKELFKGQDLLIYMRTFN